MHYQTVRLNLPHCHVNLPCITLNTQESAPYTGKIVPYIAFSVYKCSKFDRYMAKTCIFLPCQVKIGVCKEQSQVCKDSFYPCNGKIGLFQNKSVHCKNAIPDVSCAFLSVVKGIRCKEHRWRPVSPRNIMFYHPILVS